MKVFRRLAMTGAVVAAMLGFFVTPASAAYSYSVSSLPWSDSQVNACIGGAICGYATGVNIQFTHRMHVSTVRVYAHDQIGDKTEARLSVFSDHGHEDGFKDVKKDGSWLTYNVNGDVTFLGLEARGQGCCSYDEVAVLQIQIQP